MAPPAHVIVQLARRHLRLTDRVYYAPHIPYSKEQNVRRVYELAFEEPVLVLFDDTAWGSGKDGFVLTPRQLCWRELWSKPRSLPLDEIGTWEIKLRSAPDKGVLINEQPLSLVLLPEAKRPAVANLLEAIRDWRGESHPFRAAPGESVSTYAGTRNPTREEVLQLARFHLEDVPSMFVAPHIHERTVKNVRQIHTGSLPFDEEILALHDNTAFGDGSDGWLATTERLCWRNAFYNPRVVMWRDLPPEVPTLNKHVVLLDGAEIWPSVVGGVAAATVAFISAILSRVHGL